MWQCKCGGTNSDTSNFCQSCGGNKRTSIYTPEKQELQQKIAQQQAALQAAAAERERRENRFEKLSQIGLDGYYEYKVISLQDESGLFRRNSGRLDIDSMAETLNQLGAEGWHLVTAYSSELGKNMLSGGAGGAVFGSNSTVDEHILIFERFVKSGKA